MENFTIKQMLEVGVHYGHDVRRWNPKMAPYIFKKFNNVHIINLAKTAPMLFNALVQMREVVSRGGRVLFVGTKRQVAPIVKEYAEKCGQYYINHRWLGGILTNWKTISQSITTLVELEKLIESGMEGYTKKEQLSFKRQMEKLNAVLGGIRNMGGLPNILFVIDSKKEYIAVNEAKKLNIPVVAVVDTNGNPDNINYPIPGNDDAIKAIDFYCRLACSAVLEGLEAESKAGAKPKPSTISSEKGNGKTSTPKEKSSKEAVNAKSESKPKAGDTAQQEESKIQENKPADDVVAKDLSSDKA